MRALALRSSGTAWPGPKTFSRRRYLIAAPAAGAAGRYQARCLNQAVWTGTQPRRGASVSQEVVSGRSVLQQSPAGSAGSAGELERGRARGRRMARTCTLWIRSERTMPPLQYLRNVRNYWPAIEHSRSRNTMGAKIRLCMSSVLFSVLIHVTATAQALPQYEIIPFSRYTNHNSKFWVFVAEAYKVDRKIGDVRLCRVFVQQQKVRPLRAPATATVSFAGCLAVNGVGDLMVTNFATTQNILAGAPPNFAPPGELWGIDTQTGDVQFLWPVFKVGNPSVKVPNAVGSAN